MNLSNNESHRQKATQSSVDTNSSLISKSQDQTSSERNNDKIFTTNSDAEKPTTSSVNWTLEHFMNSLPSANRSNNDIEENLPSTSNTLNGTDNANDNHHSSQNNSKENVNGPSTSGSCKNCDSKRQVLEKSRDDDSSSDTGHDDYSLGSQDGCIYTYRGGEMADLPSSFYSLDMGLPLDNHLPDLPGYPARQEVQNDRGEIRSRASSPDMDFLEMDFDPGPSGEADTGDESSPDVENAIQNIPEDNPPEEVQNVIPEVHTPEVRQKSPMTCTDNLSIPPPMPSTSKSVQQNSHHNDELEASCSSATHYGPYIIHVNFKGEKLLVRRTMMQGSSSLHCNVHVSNGEFVFRSVSYDEENNEAQLVHQINQNERGDSLLQTSALYHLSMAKKLLTDKVKSDKEGNEISVVKNEYEGMSVEPCSGFTEVSRCMIWSELEACERQVTQIATSACGATAVVNVFNALGVPVHIDRINTAVGTRERHNFAPVPRYLLSRAVAGCTAADLVSGIQRASDGLVTARFFPTYPERVVSLSHWLADWISIGAVPILTLNLQAGCDASDIPDAWHHQMVFGVSPRGVCLCNPAECVKEGVLWPRLVTPSVLLVRSRDVLARYTPDTDLTPLLAVPDRRFHSYNVLGQVVNVIREWKAAGCVVDAMRTRHIRIPASYQAGVTIATLTGSDAHRRLMHATQLPILKE